MIILCQCSGMMEPDRTARDRHSEMTCYLKHGNQTLFNCPQAIKARKMVYMPCDETQSQIIVHRKHMLMHVAINLSL